jgi:imidazolonepropionase-like amidohydrolase
MRKTKEEINNQKQITMKRLNIILGLLILAQFSWAQSDILSPAPTQDMPIVITGATAHLGNGTKIDNAAIAFSKGKISFVGRAADWSGTDDHIMIDATGKHVYPGFISANTTLGLREIDAVNATRDEREIGMLNPNVRSIIAYNTDSDIIPTLRSNGVLMAQVCPVGGRMSGKSSIVQLDAWNWEDAAYKMDEGQHLNWPSAFSYNWRRGTFGKNKDYNKEIKAIREFLDDAKAYCSISEDKLEQANLKLESMRMCFDKKAQLYIHVNSAKEIQESVLFAEEYGMKIVIVGGVEAYKITDFLVEHQIPVILQRVTSLPNGNDVDIDMPFKKASLLEDAGVLYCFSVGGFWRERNLPFQAGQSVAFGLDYEAAVSSLTLKTAVILGIDDRVGSLERGKDATLFISDGDALDYLGNKVGRIFIQGRDVSTENKQKALYRKYKKKYERQ